MKAVVNDKKHLTLVSHTNGVTIVEESGCIIDLDFQSLASICEIADLGNIYTIKDCDEIESLKSNNELTELRNQIIGLINELNLRASVISQKNEEIEQLKSDITKLRVDIAKFQAYAANVSDIEYELNKCRETNNALIEKLESKLLI